MLTLTAERVTRLHSSLEPAHIAQTFQLVCAEVLGSSETSVFVYDGEDRAKVVRFGAEEQRVAVNLRDLEGVGVAELMSDRGTFAAPRVGGPWRALLPLGVGEEAVGILQVAFERAIDSSGLAQLNEMGQALAVAVRNGLLFEKTRRLTFTDDLTALYNSRFMALYLDRELKRCRRARSSLTLLFMDLDGFKNVNDSHGHLAGSRTLVEVGAALEKTVRDADVLIRYGGDEFVIVFPETPLSGGLVIAEKIRQVIGATNFLAAHKIEARVSASIGIAAYPETADDVRSLISSADQAMYRAKALGKNRVVVASPFSSSASPPRP
jgi:diguanylate cyclase (GGDEF)-like protein